jgi:hypothetical protein
MLETLGKRLRMASHQSAERVPCRPDVWPAEVMFVGHSPRDFIVPKLVRSRP